MFKSLRGDSIPAKKLLDQFLLCVALSHPLKRCFLHKGLSCTRLLTGTPAS